MKVAAREGVGYCMLTMVLFMVFTIFLTVNLLNLGINGKSSYRRSLHEPPTTGDDTISQNVTVIELGPRASGTYIPTMEIAEKIATHDIVVRDVPDEPLNIGFIICKGNVTNYVTVSNLFIASVKSIIIFTNQRIIFRIVSNDVDAVNDLIEKSFPNSPSTFEFDVRPDFTPNSLSSLKEVLKFKGCGHLKVTFHHTFSDVDNLLLLDVDTIVLRPIEELFGEFKMFGKNTVMAMAEEHPWNDQGYYSHRPYAHNPAGLNGGLLLYNFTRIRENNFASPSSEDQTHSFEDALVESINYHLLPRKQFLADQCAVNALFHHNPDKMRLLPCQWNLRAWAMMECLNEPCYCKGLKETGGCALLHGQGRSFVPYKRNIGYFTVWKTVLDYDWDRVEGKQSQDLIETIRSNLFNITEQSAELDQSGLSVLRECI